MRDRSREAVSDLVDQIGRSIASISARVIAAIRLSPKSGAAFGGRGKAHIAREEIYQGIADFDYALMLDDSLNLYADRGAALVKVGKPEDAAADFTNALARDPNNATLLAQRGVEYFKAGQPDQAKADLERAIALDPSLARHPPN